jgi:hypothetical protein
MGTMIGGVAGCVVGVVLLLRLLPVLGSCCLYRCMGMLR